METEEIIRDFLKFAYEFHFIQLTQMNEDENFDGVLQPFYMNVTEDWLTSLIESYINYTGHDRRIEYADKE